MSEPTEALLPCPFCGNHDNDIVDDRWMCNCCMAEGPPSRIDPARAWNRRATHSTAVRPPVSGADPGEVERVARAIDPSAWQRFELETSWDRLAVQTICDKDSSIRAAERAIAAIAALAEPIEVRPSSAIEQAIRTTLGGATHLDAGLIEDTVAAALAVMPRPSSEVVEALRAADKALRDYACHAGPKVPCARTAGQCASECGRAAGDALMLVEAALTSVSDKGEG